MQRQQAALQKLREEAERQRRELEQGEKSWRMIPPHAEIIYIKYFG